MAFVLSELYVSVSFDVGRLRLCIGFFQSIGDSLEIEQTVLLRNTLIKSHDCYKRTLTGSRLSYNYQYKIS